MSDFLSSARLRRMDGEQIVQGGVLGSSMVPILSREIFAVLKWLRVRMPNVGVDLKRRLDYW